MLQTVLKEKLTFPHLGHVQSLSRVPSEKFIDKKVISTDAIKFIQNTGVEYILLQNSHLSFENYHQDKILASVPAIRIKINQVLLNRAENHYL